MNADPAFVAPADIALARGVDRVGIGIERCWRIAPPNALDLPMCLGDLHSYVRRRSLDEREHLAAVIRDLP